MKNRICITIYLDLGKYSCLILITFVKAYSEKAKNIACFKCINSFFLEFGTVLNQSRKFYFKTSERLKVEELCTKREADSCLNETKTFFPVVFGI